MRAMCGAVEVIDEEGATDADLVAQQRALASLVSYRQIPGCPMAFGVYRGGKIRKSKTTITGRVHGWKQALNTFAIHYGDRLTFNHERSQPDTQTS